MTLDAGYLLASVIAFALCCIGVLDAVGVYDAKAGLFGAPTLDTLLPDQIFFM